jgi:hypothetical protein
MTPLQQIERWLEEAKIPEAELARRCNYDKGNFHRMLRSEGDLSLAAALRLFDATDLQLGPLQGLTKREIETARRIAA